MILSNIKQPRGNGMAKDENRGGILETVVVGLLLLLLAGVVVAFLYVAVT
jgi:hypothetical protein